jgi:hypothetical protein
MSEAKKVKGGCHCGAVRYEIEIDLTQPINRCNCRFCTMTATANVIVKPQAFTLLDGADSLADYRVGQSPNRFPFCKVCGIHAFGQGHLPQLGGDYYAANVLTLDDVDPSRLTYVYWDGRHNNWRAGTRPEPWPVSPAS